MPVCKHTFNLVYGPKDVMFEFPIYESLEYRISPSSVYLKLTVLDKGLFGKDLLGRIELSAKQWFNSTAIAFEDPHNKVYVADDFGYGCLDKGKRVSERR